MEYICKCFKSELKKIADNLEKERLKIYQEKVCPWETDKEYVNNWIVEIVTSINNVAEYVEYMDFEKDRINK